MPLSVHIKFAAPRTCWWVNDWHPDHQARMREDKLFAINRLYHRRLRAYSYVLIIGRFSIRLSFLSKQGCM